MDEVTWNTKKLKEVKSAKKDVETAIRLFGPASVTNIQEREMFGDKLAAITKKLETYIENAQVIIAELEDLRDREAGTETETECVRRIDDIRY